MRSCTRAQLHGVQLRENKVTRGFSFVWLVTRGLSCNGIILMAIQKINRFFILCAFQFFRSSFNRKGKMYLKAQMHNFRHKFSKF